MYLFDSQDHSLAGGELVSTAGPPASANPAHSIFAALLGEERPIDMLTLLSLLVLLLHVWLLTWLLRPVEQLTPAQPLMMEVSMLAVSAPKPAVAPPPPAPPPPAKKTPPKKTKPKPVRKPPPPVAQ
ncbi:energy transducer TonB, partial [Methylomonas sp. WSC-6]|nr:energy transducer TonB [Methylomonas sp. WSC-6]